MAEFVGLGSQYQEGQTLSFRYQDYQPSMIGRVGIQPTQLILSFGGPGIDSTDLAGSGLTWSSASGTFTYSGLVAWSSVTGIGTASISISIRDDSLTEGTEYLSISRRGKSEIARRNFGRPITPRLQLELTAKPRLDLS